MKHEEDGEDELAVLKDETRRAVRTAKGIRARRLLNSRLGMKSKS